VVIQVFAPNLLVEQFPEPKEEEQAQRYPD